MPKPSLSSLAAGVVSRLGRLTVQTAKQARVRAERATRKSLAEVTRLLDDAIEATNLDEGAGAKGKTKALPGAKGRRPTNRR